LAKTGLGLVANETHIVVVPYDPAWSEMFEKEAAKIIALFGRELVAIHHIGSTAVPGLSAKPIIDMMPVVRDIERLVEFNPAMMRLGYEPRRKSWPADFRTTSTDIWPAKMLLSGRSSERLRSGGPNRPLMRLKTQFERAN
jgi:GrpB-like predicted nucleotidyltransferase (UPF0157 family)